MRVARLPQNQRALEGAKHVALLSSPVGGEGSLADTRPLGVAQHVEKIKVGRH